MKKIAATFGFIIALWANLAGAQTQFPTTLQANSVWGRLGIGSGPGQAIPFSILSANLFGATLAPLHGVLIGEGTAAFNGVLLGDAQVLVGQTSADPQAKTLSGDVSMVDTGAVTIGAGAVTGSKIASATITGSNIASATVTGANLVLSIEPQGRCTLTTATPVMTSTVTGANTVFYTPYKGRFTSLWNGSNYVITDTGGELSQLTTDTTKSPAAVVNNSNYDIFTWSDSGTVRATRGPAWASDTSRGTGAGTTQLVYQNGLLVNANAITNGPAALAGTYVCTVRSNGTATIDMNFGGSASGGTAAVLGVWNNYNRVNTIATVTDTGTSYTYTSATVRQARASAGNQVTVIMGLAEDGANANYQAGVTTAAAAGANTFWGIGVDTTSAFSFQAASGRAASAAVQTFAFPAVANVSAGQIALGKHVISANEASDGTNANTFDNSSANVLFVQTRQ